MGVFKAYSEKVEVNGQTVLAVIKGMGAMKSVGNRLLEEAGLYNVTENGWYSQQKWLNAFKVIAEKVGKHTLRSIGNSIPESAKFPPHINDIHSALASIDIAYKLNHRNGEIGFYRYKKVSDNEAEMFCKNPYPSEFDYGIIEAVSKKFADPGVYPKVITDTTKESRTKGGESCTFIVRW
ncbi:MAG: hypothetical protein WCJ01_07625 [Ignavibacteria bacterium]